MISREVKEARDEEESGQYNDSSFGKIFDEAERIEHKSNVS